MVKANSYWC